MELSGVKQKGEKGDGDSHEVIGVLDLVRCWSLSILAHKSLLLNFQAFCELADDLLVSENGQMPHISPNWATWSFEVVVCIILFLK